MGLLRLSRRNINENKLVRNIREIDVRIQMTHTECESTGIVLETLGKWARPRGIPRSVPCMLKRDVLGSFAYRSVP